MSLSTDDKRIFKSTLLLGYPIILQELINSLTNLLDVFMIGKLGEKEVAAVGNGNELLFLFALFIFGIISGASAFIGQFWGKKELHNIHKTMGLSYIFSLSAALIFFIPCQLMPEFIIAFYIKDDLVIQYGASYLRVISYTFFIISIIFTNNSALKSIGQAKLPFYTSTVALVSNLCLNYLFIFVLDKGVVGAAIATLIARIIELIVQLILIKKLRMPIYTSVNNYFGADKRFLIEYVTLITPVVLNEVFWSVGVTLYRKAFSHLGAESAAAYYLTAPIQQVFMIFGISLGTATGILIANNLGSGDREEAIKYSRKAPKLAVGISIIMSLILFIFSNSIVNFYEVSDQTKQNALNIIYIMCFVLVVKTYNFTAIVGILRNGGDNLFCLLVDAFAVWLVGVPLSFLGSYYFGLPVYFVFALSSLEEVSKLFLCVKRVHSNKWAKVLYSEEAKIN